MNESIVKEIFIEIALAAIQTGKELRLERRTDTSNSETLGGAFAKSVTNNDGLSLYVYSNGEMKTEEDLAAEEEEATP